MFKPKTLSSNSLFALSIITGRLLCALILRTVFIPSKLGIITSIINKSTTSDCNTSSACKPSYAFNTSYPSAFRYISMAFTISCIIKITFTKDIINICYLFFNTFLNNCIHNIVENKCFII